MCELNKNSMMIQYDCSNFCRLFTSLKCNFQLCLPLPRFPVTNLTFSPIHYIYMFVYTHAHTHTHEIIFGDFFC